MASPLPIPDLGRLTPMDLREVWQSESGDFTPWLARPENIALLGETIGLDLVVLAQEKEVGPFRADILCKDPTSEELILIENQLERTDHTHLGQILTYAAGLKTVLYTGASGKYCGKDVDVRADAICVHSDTPNAVAIAEAVREAVKPNLDAA